MKMNATQTQQDQSELGIDIQLLPGSIKSAMKSVDAASRDLWQVAPDKLKVLDNFNVRIKDEAYYTHIRWIADSINLEGFYQDKPLAGYVTKDGDIFITDGHCRLEAILLAISEGAEIQKVPVVVSPAGISMEDLTVVLVRGNGGKALTPYEIGVVCKRLVRFGLEVHQFAPRIGFGVPYINSLLMLMASPIEIRNMVINSKVSATTAIEMLSKHGDKALGILQEAEARAKATGKERVTGKHVAPDHAFKKAVKKSAVPMFTALNEIKADPCYLKLDKTVREKLDALLETLNAEAV